MSDCCAFYRGRVYFTPVAGVRRQVGNVSELLLTPVRDSMELLDASGDACCEIVSCAVQMTFSCMTPENLAIALGSEVTTTTAAGVTTVVHKVGQQCNGYGAIEFEGENAFGGTILVSVPSVRLNTSEKFNLISRDDVESVTLTGRVLPTAAGWFTVTTTNTEGC